MLVIIEGPDGSGKSTLLKELVKNDYKNITAVPREWPNVFDYCYTLYNYCSCDNKKYVMDRSIITEWIYRFVKNDKNITLEFNELSSLLSIENMHIVFCENDNAYNNAILRGEDYVLNKKEHDDITYLYNFVKHTVDKMCPNTFVHTYNYCNKSVNDLIKELEAM